MDSIKELIDAANKYVNDQEPWKLSKDVASHPRLAAVSYVTLECVRFLSVMLAPIMPNKANAMRAQLGLAGLSPNEGDDLWPDSFGELEAGTEIAPGKPVFPRIDKKQEKALLERLVPGGTSKEEAGSSGGKSPTPSKKSKKSKPAEPLPEGVIAFDDFAKVELRVGVIRVAEKVPKKDRLLRLEIDLGEPEARQVLAGIAEHFAADDLVGRRVLVVANLAPRKLAGLVSQGMVLAVDTESGLELVTVPDSVPPGTRAS